MPKSLSGLLDRNVLTAIVIALVGVVFTVASIAAITGHYDSHSVRAFIDDLKWLAGAGLLGTAVGRGLIGAAQRHADGQALLRDLPAAPADEERSTITTPPGPAA